MPAKEVKERLEQPVQSITPVMPKPLGFYFGGSYQWFDSDEEAIAAAKALMTKNELTSLDLVRQAGVVKLEPTVELYG